MRALVDVGDGRFVDVRTPERSWRRCATSSVTDCNWLVDADDAGGLCEACALTRTRPADGDREGLAEYVEAERAKRRLLFQLYQLNLPVGRRDEVAESGLAFDLLSSTSTKVVTGHDDGVITLDLAEVDDQHRETLRRQLGEPYRTVLGHFRHEIGHYFWPLLVTDDQLLTACRSLFGDDRADYAEAVQKHYASSDFDDLSWTDEHISRYATMHPYEDWAETFAHYLHILDVLETARSFDIAPGIVEAGEAAVFGEVVDSWLSLAYGLNQINRSMGRSDLYPFVLTPAVIRKLSFIDGLVTRR